MANTEIIIPIVVAAVGLLGSIVSVLLTLRTSRLVHLQTVSNLSEKYSQPLLVAANDLQQRLFELVEYPISEQHLTTDEGLEDLKKYTYGISIVRQELQVEKDANHHVIDEELDRRRDGDGGNVGVWPASRIKICERMMVVKKTDLDAALDGGFTVDVKGFDLFRKEWDKQFRQPMGFFCEWIDLMLEGRVHKTPYSSSPLRVLQHFLVDLVYFLDGNCAYITHNRENLKCKQSERGCGCASRDCGGEKNLDNVLKSRQDTRYNDAGIWCYEGFRESRTEGKYEDKQIDLTKVKNMSYTIDMV
ncbi:hypothetical protein GQ44DRAFT_777336 [Phaeosphaeriaceae sp. PMI808]|nr:hypothetical protein GQ44DRAFT_777336 [Phaeosphaeriaceae sp. PMI808]